MKNKYLVVIVCVFLILFSGCKVKKSDKSTYDIKETQTEDTATTMNSEKETDIKSGAKSEAESNTSEQKTESSEETTESWKETNYYDKEGNLRKTVKEGTTKNKKTDSQSNKNDNKQQSDSTYNNTNIKESIDSTSVSSSYNNIDANIDIDQNMQSDSRLIQGVEWLYVIGVFLLISGIVVFFLRKKYFD